jgi:hypothetical protein
MQRILFSDGTTLREINSSWAERFDVKPATDDDGPFLIAVGIDGTETDLCDDYDLVDMGCCYSITCEETVKKRLDYLCRLALTRLIEKVKSGQEVIEISQVLEEANEELINRQVRQLFGSRPGDRLWDLVSEEVQRHINAKTAQMAHETSSHRSNEQGQGRWIYGPSWMLKVESIDGITVKDDKVTAMVKGENFTMLSVDDMKELPNYDSMEVRPEIIAANFFGLLMSKLNDQFNLPIDAVHLTLEAYYNSKPLGDGDDPDCPTETKLSFLGQFQKVARNFLSASGHA